MPLDAQAEAVTRVLDSLDDEFYESTRPARDAVRTARGDEKIQIYVKNKILSPLKVIAGLWLPLTPANSRTKLPR